ncbi:hypothetical protein MJO28_010244 [Puccinia striiformis f. sp. tritici]|uniref:Uncharacterized protein n=1 Tax=Puccinia striiformis f. sp. tritici TaxID=168172 RepID=A0ACC0E3Y5_9BASI|nr:hypothetical protein MJO28_010244 [Puccinia striiformis f. sp. tritici]KAI7948321.1 hypothetical protein MJO29_009986 [Puccinia striiformis f. sp. tritici]
MSNQSQQSPSSHQAPSLPKAKEFKSIIFEFRSNENITSTGKGSLHSADSASPHLEFLSKTPPSTSILLHHPLTCQMRPLLDLSGPKSPPTSFPPLMLVFRRAL